MSILEAYSMNIEVYSIDEAFLELGEGSDLTFYKQLQEIRHIVFQYTGLPVSLGLAPTKTLAKIATHLAKKNPEHNGCFVLSDKMKTTSILSTFPVEEIWGIGRRSAKRLTMMGVKTALQFVNLQDDLILKEFTIVGLRIKNELLGKPSITFESSQKSKKAICTARSFGSMIRDYDYLEQAIASHCITCAVKLRKQHSFASSMMVFVHTNAFREDLPQYKRNIIIKFPATQSSLRLVKSAKEGLRNIYKPGFDYKKAGVILMDFQQETALQTDLFNNEKYDHKDAQLMHAIDLINDKYCRDTLKLADQGLSNKHALKQNKRSKSYTTDWNEILEIKTSKQ